MCTWKFTVQRSGAVLYLPNKAFAQAWRFKTRDVLSFHLKEEWQLNKGGEKLLVGSPTPAELLGKAKSKKAWLASFPIAAGPPGKAKLITSPLVNKSIIAISIKVSQV